MEWQNPCHVLIKMFSFVGEFVAMEIEIEYKSKTPTFYFELIV